MKISHRRLGSVALLCGGVVALWIASGWLSAPRLTNDSYQYLDAAANIASGRCICLDFAHFDEQVEVGHFPVPLTHYPPGYPLLIAGVSRMGLRMETAGYLVSAAAFLLTLWLIWDTGLRLGGRPVPTFCIAAVWMWHRVALLFAVSALTESVFLALTMGVIAVMVRDLQAHGSRPKLLAGIGALAGMAYCVRYAGIFVIPPAVLYLLWRSWRSRGTLLSRRTWLWALGGIAMVGVFTIPVQLRNLAFTGSWRGLDFSSTPFSLLAVIAPSVVAVWRLVLGQHWPVRLEVCLALPLIGATILWRWAARSWRRRAFSSETEIFPIALVWILVFGSAYVVGIIVAKTSLANMNLLAEDLERYFLPVFPLFLAALAGAVSTIRSRSLQVSCAAAALGIMALNAPDLREHIYPQQQVLVATNLAQEIHPGESLRSWLLSRVPPGGVVVAEEGQALHFVLQRPVVSVLEPPEFSNRPTDAAGIRALMSRYRSRYLLLFPLMRTPKYSLPFLHRLFTVETVDWLQPVMRKPGVAVYECDACAR